MTGAHEGWTEPLDGFWYCHFGVVQDVSAIRIQDLPVWRKVPVPKPLNELFPLAHDWEGEVIYGRVFRRPDLTGDRGLILCMDGVYPGAEIFLNGQRVGATLTGFTGHQFDLTPFLREGENLLLARIRFSAAEEIPRPEAPLPLGIWAPARLAIKPRCYIRHAQVKSRINGTWRLDLTFSKPLEARVALDLVMHDSSGRKVLRQKAALAPGKAFFSLPGKKLDKVLPWDLAYPSLYHLTIETREGVDDAMTVDFGFRRFTFGAKGFRLNGRRCFLRAVWDDLVFPGWGRTVPAEEALTQRLTTIRDLGFNTLFCAGAIPDARVVKAADRLGLLLWYELPPMASLAYEGDEHAQRLLAATIRRDASSPSWVMINLFQRRIPTPMNYASTWFRKMRKVCAHSGVVLLPGPSEMLSQWSPCRFLPPEGLRFDDPREKKPVVAWPIEPVPIPKVENLLGRRVETLGARRTILSGMDRVQAEQVQQGIQAARGESGVHGYLIKRLYDGPDEKTGFFTDKGHPKAIAQVLRQQDDWVGVLSETQAVETGEQVAIEVGVSRMSDYDFRQGIVRCQGLDAEKVLDGLENSPCARAGTLTYQAPHTVGPKVCELSLCLESPARHMWAENSAQVLLLPKRRRKPRRLYLGPELAQDGDFQERLTAQGYQIMDTLENARLGLWSAFQYDLAGWLQRGGRGVFLFERPDAFPSGQVMRLGALDAGRGFFWMRADSPVFSGVTKEWIGGGLYDRFRSSLYFEGLPRSCYTDALAGFLMPDAQVFYPAMLFFKLGHGLGLMSTLPLRKSYGDGHVLAGRVLEDTLDTLLDGRLVHPRFVPDISPREVLVPLSRQGSVRWRMAFEVSGERWRSPNLDDRRWAGSRGAFGRHGAPGLVIRYTWETPDIYLRTWFDLKRWPRKLALTVFHDRDVAIALNGHRIFQRSGYTTDLETVTLDVDPRTVLRMGRNLLAVHCHQPEESHNLDVGLMAVY